MRRAKKILKWTFIVVGGLVAILLIVNAILVWTTGSRLERELAKIRAAGDPVSLADIRFEAVPPEQNAATYLRRAKDGLDAIDLETFAAAQGAGSNWDCPAVYDATRSAVAAYPKVIPLLEKAADCPDFVRDEAFNLAGASDSKAAMETLLALAQENREVVRLLGGNWPRSLMAEGKRDEAVRSAIAALKLTRHFDREPCVVSFLVSLACRSIVCATLNDALQSGPVSEDIRKELDEELAKHDMNRAFHESLRTERAFGLDRFRTFPGAGSWFPRAVYNMWMLDYLRLIDGYIADARVESSTGSAAASTPPKPAYVLSSLVDPALRGALSGTKRITSMLNAIRVLNALQRRADPEKLPAADLSDLGLPKEATLDAFTGKPLVVKKVPGGWLVYSVGLDGKDDGGQVTSEKDSPPDVGYAPPKARP